MGPDEGAVTVFQGGDDPSTVGVVLRVCAGDHIDVQRQPDAIALDLDVALLHQVEQAHLNALRQVGQLVDAKDSSVGARDHAVMDSQLIRQVPALRDFDGVDLADEIGHRNIGRRQLLPKTVVSMEPRDGGLVAQILYPIVPDFGHGREGIVVHLGPFDDGNVLVQEIRHRSDQPRLGLAALPQEDQVVAREDRVLQLRDDRLFIANDPGEQLLPFPDFPDEILPQLVFDRDDLVARFLESS